MKTNKSQITTHDNMKTQDINPSQKKALIAHIELLIEWGQNGNPLPVDQNHAWEQAEGITYITRWTEDKYEASIGWRVMESYGDDPGSFISPIPRLQGESHRVYTIEASSLTALICQIK